MDMSIDDKTFVAGIGAQKAGTSWLRNYLSRRKDIHFAATELHFFDTQSGPLNQLRHDSLWQRAQTRKHVQENSLLRMKLELLELLKDGASYKRYFEERVPGDVRVFGEITPSYALIGESGFRAIRELFPRSRIIFVMRDPVDRLYSHVRMTRDRRKARGKDQLDTRELLNRSSYLNRSLY